MGGGVGALKKSFALIVAIKNFIRRQRVLILLETARECIMQVRSQISSSFFLCKGQNGSLNRFTKPFWPTVHVLIRFWLSLATLDQLQRYQPEFQCEGFVTTPVMHDDFVLVVPCPENKVPNIVTPYRDCQSLAWRSRQRKRNIQKTPWRIGDRSFWNVLCLQSDVLRRLHHVFYGTLHFAQWTQDSWQSVQCQRLWFKILHKLSGRRFSSQCWRSA